MTNDQVTNGCDAASSSFWLRTSFVIRLARRSLAKAAHSCFACRGVAERRRVISSALILMLLTGTCCVAMAQAQSPNVIGTWNVEITFTNGDHRSLRFDAQEVGKGTFQLLDPRSKVWGSDKPSEAKWTQGDGNAVTFSGAVEFLIGNVGRDAGTLVCKGNFETESLITGQVEFSPLVGGSPSKSGTFKAVRAAGGGQ